MKTFWPTHCQGLIALFIAATLSAFATPDVGARQVVLVVESNQIDANVFADDEWVGAASQSPFRLPAGVRLVTVSPPGVDAWSIDPVRVDIASADTDTVRVDASFPYHYKFESVPLNVAVSLRQDGQSTRLGVAPLLHVSDDPISGTFVFEKEGYRPEERPAASDLWNRYLVQLEVDSDALRSVPDLAIRQRRGGNRRWIDVASLTAAVAAGALAVHYRTKADNRFETWRETGDPVLKKEIQRLDVRSGVALGTMQVGIGVFAFRLAF